MLWEDAVWSPTGYRGGGGAANPHGGCVHRMRELLEIRKSSESKVTHLDVRTALARTGRKAF